MVLLLCSFFALLLRLLLRCLYYDYALASLASVLFDQVMHVSVLFAFAFVSALAFAVPFAVAVAFAFAFALAAAFATCQVDQEIRGVRTPNLL